MIHRLGTLKEKVTKKQHSRIDEQCKKTNGYSKRVPKGNASDQKHCNKTEHCLNTFISRPDMGASLVAQRLKHLPAMRETWALSLGWEDPLEKEMADPSSILAWRIPWTEEPGRLQPTGSQSLTQLSNLTFTFRPDMTWERISEIEDISTENSKTDNQQ